jgi:two-component system cell cycle response regulator
MYANKASRSSASRQVTDALLQVITEQNASLDEHLERVSQLAGTLAVALGQPDHEVRRIRLAAKLHDVGKTAIPAAILAKPGPLDEREWEFMRRHPSIGARIVSAAPALKNTAELIHPSHERITDASSRSPTTHRPVTDSRVLMAEPCAARYAPAAARSR